jgi:hypothetical protein
MKTISTMKIVILWTSGLLASGIYGVFIGVEFRPHPGDPTSMMLGMGGTAAAFTCARLWWSERAAKPATPPIASLAQDR